MALANEDSVQDFKEQSEVQSEQTCYKKRKVLELNRGNENALSGFQLREHNSKKLQLDTFSLVKKHGYHQHLLESPCVICRANEDEENSLLCDCCDMCVHSYCISLSCIPDGQWICPWCTRSQTIESRQVFYFVTPFHNLILPLRNLNIT